MAVCARAADHEPAANKITAMLRDNLWGRAVIVV
jgi:hypothetical protein